MLIALGNSPSSGSSLFADLLDSCSLTACGPELSLFAVESLYDYEKFSHNPFRSSRCSNIYLNRPTIRKPALAAYGFTENSFRVFVSQFNSLTGFLDGIRKHYLLFRDKDEHGIVFEKTPQNSNTLDQYLANTDSPFIHIVRNPAYMYASLLRRGVSPGVALATWVVEQSIIYKHKDNPRLITVKYEDLVKKPFAITANIINSIKPGSASASEIEEEYCANEYRRQHAERISSWSQREIGLIVDANSKQLDKCVIEKIALINKFMVSDDYSRIFNLCQVPGETLLRHFGYYEDLRSLTSDAEKKGFRFSKRDRSFLRKRYFADLFRGEASFFSIRGYLNPIIYS
jgi:hypothetical protein